MEISLRLSRCGTVARGLLFAGACMFSSEAIAQDLGSIAASNMAFDQQFNAQLGGMMQQNQMAQQQLMQNYIAQNGPRLQQEYQQYVAQTGQQIPFESFVWSHMMTAGGTNPGPALEAQRRNFEGLQTANRTVQEGYASYNGGYYANQNTLSGVYNRYNEGAIQGNAQYQNPQTGEVYTMPYGGQSGMYNSPNGNTFVNDSQGNYHQVDPQGYTQQMYEYSGE